MGNSVNRLEQWVERSVPSTHQTRMESSELHTQFLGPYFDFKEIDYIIWDEQNREVVFIETKMLHDPSNPNHDNKKTPADERFVKGLAKKMLVGFIMANSQQLQTETWQRFKQAQGKDLTDAGWAWRFMIVINIQTSPDMQFLFGGLQDQLINKFRVKLLDLLGFSHNLPDSFSRFLVLTPASARQYFPHLFPTAYDATL